jgi:signal transduction histidine kinase/ligand-binding sensor domain-containing protein/AraC-like DNA-binding protein
MNKLLILFLFLFYLSINQGITENSIIFKNIDNKQGLSQNGAVAIFQDLKGYMWFGTHYGLNRYDGFTIKSYYKGNSYNDLCGNDILSILQDSAGNIWVATIEGISVLNPVNDKFYNLSKYSSNENVFKHTIQSMKLIDGEILLSSSDGLWKIDPGINLFNDKIAKSICSNIKSCKIQPIINLKSIKVYFKDKNDNYWITSTNRIISSKIVDNKLLVIDEIEIEKNKEVEITVLYQDNFSNIWAGTLNDGLYKIYEEKGKYIPIKVYPNKANNNTFSRITDILQDKSSDLWISSRSDGVRIIPKDELNKKEMSVVKLTKNTLPTPKIRSLYKSRDNTLWLGSLGNGVFFYNNSGLKFTNYQLGNKIKNPAVNYTRTISKDIYNRLWFGTLFEGLYVYNTQKQQVVKSMLNKKSVFAINPIDNEHYLIGCTDGLYLIKYNKESFQVEQLNKNEIKGPVFSISTSADKIWISSGQGFFSIELSADYKITQIKNYSDKLVLDSKSQNTIRCVKFDEKSNCLWIGSETGGLVRATLDSQFNIKDFTSINKKFNIVSSNNYICDIYIDNEYNCWVGSRSGLIKLELSNTDEIKNITVYTTNDGLSSNMIQSIADDNIGNLWLGTIRGLVKFNKRSYDIINYDINDGIQDYEFAEHASFVDKNGYMYFGGINGVSEFWPNQLRQDNFVEPVIISELVINNINANDLHVQTNSETLTLPYNDNNIKFNFISLNFINPLKCKYAYMLEGYDKDWRYTSADKKYAEYSNLPQGRYEFKVKATNEDGIWTSNHTSFHFEILPSFWLSFPGLIFYVLVIAIIILVVSSITKKRVRKKHKELLEKQYHEQIEKINQSKLQFFINISHEIRTPLTLIVCSIEKLISNLNLNKEQQKETATIDRNVNRMLQLTNELLEIRKIETGNYQLNVKKDDIVSYIHNIVLVFESLAEKQEMKLSVESFSPKIIIWFDANALEKVLCNLISNAIKYTKRKGFIKIDIKSSVNNEFIEISVTDNGIGIEQEHLSRIFDRFYQHGANIDSYENGFGIGLSLTKNLIELHKGTISVASEINKGSVFTIRLPLGESIYSGDEKADKVIWKTEINSTYYGVQKQDIIVESVNDYDEDEITVDPEKFSILYIDDNKELLENISDYLSETYNVITATNGKIGFEKAILLQPDVIISDIVMPVMDGFELCNLIKTDINTSHIPVILLTAKGDSDSQYKGIEIGADYFIPKPFNIKLLSLTIKNLIESREKLRKLFISNQYTNSKEITTNTRDEKFLDKLLKYVEEHIGEDDLNIKFIADTFAMSRSTFFRKIKAITGTTGKEFIDSVRLKRAARLLIESDLNISEIAYDIGHSNPQYFSKWFKAYYKISPTEYMAINKKK